MSLTGASGGRRVGLVEYALIISLVIFLIGPLTFMRSGSQPVHDHRQLPVEPHWGVAGRSRVLPPWGCVITHTALVLVRLRQPWTEGMAQPRPFEGRAAPS